MPIDIPSSAAEVDSRAKADVERELQQSNPFLKNSWLGAIVTAFSFRIYDFYLQLNIAVKQNFPDTATGEFLTRWAAIWGKQLTAATQATGNCVATGTLASTIPSGTTLSVSGVGDYDSTAAVDITAKTETIATLTRSGTTVTATTDSDHNLANNVSVTISGASDSAYNITAPVTVTAADEFQYEIVGTPSNEGSGSSAAFDTALIPIESVDFGLLLNLDAGTQLTLQSPIAGVDDTFTVEFGAIGGGSDIETEDSLRLRLLDRIQNPVANFNIAAIVEKAKEVSGVTRVFVQPVTPATGDVTIYFMRDNDVDPIPSAGEVTTTKNKILEIKPVNTSDAQVIVAAPTAVTTAYTFTALVPDTATTRTSITANLQQFYDENTSVGVDIEEDAYRGAIFNTVDTTTGDTVTSFTLSAPTGDITITSAQIGVLGTITYP